MLHHDTNQPSVKTEKHCIASQPSRVRWLPCAPPGAPDNDGRITTDKLFAVGCYDNDCQENVITINDLNMTTRGNNVVSSQLNSLGYFFHQGRMTDLQIADIGSEEVLMVFGDSLGSLYVTRLLVPRSPGCPPSSVKTQSGVNNSRAEAWAQCHAGEVSALDVHPISKTAVTAGADGLISVHDLAGGQSTTIKPSSSYVSYNAIRWTNPHTFVTASSAAGLQVWDVNQGSTPVTTSASSWGKDGCSGLSRPTPGPLPASITCMAVHPSRPHFCATGSSSGSVAVWDLRSQSQPLCYSPTDPDAGPVWEVKFDTRDSLSASTSSSNSTPPVLYCTEGGVLGRTCDAGGSSRSSQPAGSSSSVLGSSIISSQPEGSAILSFDVQPHSGQDLLYCTDSFSLVHLMTQQATARR